MSMNDIGTAPAALLYMVFFLEFDPFSRPLLDLPEDGFERASLVRKRVFDPNGRLRIDGAVNDALLLQFLQSLGEDSAAQVRQCRFYVAKALRSGHQLVHDETRPTLADDLHASLESRAHRKRIRSHSNHLIPIIITQTENE
jgi:hypothetical protein